jgi:polyhydroxyalkanoate synthesis regulator phasin
MGEREAGTTETSSAEMPHEEGSSARAASSQEGSDQSSLRDVIEKTLLLGLGAAALTRDRVQRVADEFVRRGQLSAEEGREMVEDLATRSRDEARSAIRGADSVIQSVFKEFGVASRREVEDLEFKSRQLEHRLALLERQADAQGGATPGSDA